MMMNRIQEVMEKENKRLEEYLLYRTLEEHKKYHDSEGWSKPWHEIAVEKIMPDIKASQNKLIEAIIDELHTFDKRYGNSVDSIKVLVDVTELLQDSISNK